MIGLIVLLAVAAIIVGCAIFLYLKSTFVKAFAMAIAAVCASAVALGLFAVLANILVSLSGGSSMLEQWGELLCYILLFVVAFAILQTIVNLLTRRPINLGQWPERIGRVVCGIFLGFTLSSVLVTLLIMALPDALQSSTLEKYLSHKEIVTQKQKEPAKPKKPAQPEKFPLRKQKRSKTAGKRDKLSDISKSVVGDQLDE